MRGNRMELNEWLEKEIVPLVRADGGWLELKEISGESAVLTAKGECAHCRALDRCVNWIGQRAENELGWKIRLTTVRDPFLWRK